MGYFAARMIVGVRQSAFFSFFIGTWVLWYVFAIGNYMNHRLDFKEDIKKNGITLSDSALKFTVKHWSWRSHAFMVISAILVAVSLGLGGHAVSFLVAGGVLWWLGDDQMTKDNSDLFHAALESRKQELLARERSKGHAVFLSAIEQKRKEDPLIGAKIGAKEVNQRLMDVMKTEKGVHIESLLCALASLGGYACQASLRSQAIAAGVSEDKPFIIAKSADGKRYFFGDPLNQYLIESSASLWNVATSGVRSDGIAVAIDVSDTFRYVTESVGTPAFGIPRFPEGHNAGDTPANYVKNLWQPILPVLKMFCKSPKEWPALFGFALQGVVQMGKGTISPDVAFMIVLESSVPMSKIDISGAGI